MYQEQTQSSQFRSNPTADNSQQQKQYPSLTQKQSKQNLDFYVSDTLELQQENQTDVKISVCGNLQKGSSLSKYTVYLIKGEDKNGPIQVYRRFNQFWALRIAMLQRWPGCFIPAVPDKNALSKMDDQIVLNRQRFLNDFVKKMARIPYLYYSQEFQTLIRSKQIQITTLFQKWPKPSFQDIINKYRNSFSELAGKQINSQTSIKISSFTTFLKASQNQLPSYKQMAKSLAISRDQLDKKLYRISEKILPDYQKNCLSEYIKQDENLMIYANSANAKLLQHSTIVKQITKKNPYWIIYDMIKFQQRDGQAMLEAINTRDSLQNRKNQIQIKIKDNQNDISEISQGKSTLKTMTTRKSKDEVKYRLQLQNQELLKEKQNLLVLVDIISALLAYITIDQYKLSKKKYYGQTIKKICGYELNLIQNMNDIWNVCGQISQKLMGKQLIEQKKQSNE